MLLEQIFSIRSEGVVGATKRTKSSFLSAAIKDSFSASSKGKSGTTKPEAPALAASSQNFSIPQLSKGFTYLVSVTGVTGERSNLEDRVNFLVQKIKQFSSNPVAVGFGISDAKHVSQVREWGADGAIVGSALVKRIANASMGMKVEEAGSFCKELRAATY